MATSRTVNIKAPCCRKVSLKCKKLEGKIGRDRDSDIKKAGYRIGREKQT